MLYKSYMKDCNGQDHPMHRMKKVASNMDVELQ